MVLVGCGEKITQQEVSVPQDDRVKQGQEGEKSAPESYKTESEMVEQKKDFLARLFGGNFFTGEKDVEPEIIGTEPVEAVSPPVEVAAADPGTIKRADVFGGVVCAAVDKSFWQVYFDDGTVADGEVLSNLQKKRDAYFRDQGYVSEYDALVDLEASRESVQFQQSVQKVIDQRCKSAFIASETVFEELFTDPFVE